MSETTQTSEQQDKPESAAPGKDPVKRWTVFVLLAVVLLLIWYLRADRVTPVTSQARLHALVVPIAPEVSGTVTSVTVGNNQSVVAGQELFQIDRERYQLAVQQSEANLEKARQALGASEAEVDAARARVVSAKASLERAEKDAIRMRSIREEDPGAISQRRIESAEATYEAAKGQVAASEANLEKAIQNVGAQGDQNSRIQEAMAALDQARLNLERSTVKAPVDGVVTDVRLDKGNFAAAGAPQMTFIATHNVWVEADFTENNLGHIDPGDEAALVFDVLPGHVLHGTVREIGFGVSVDSAPLGSLPTINNDQSWLRSAQRYPVLVEFDLPPHDLAKRFKVGSQATVVVFTGEHWLFNTLARIYMRIASWLTYAY